MLAIRGVDSYNLEEKQSGVMTAEFGTSPEWIVLDILDARNRMRKLEREINKSHDKDQISMRMATRKKLLAEISTLQSEIANRIPEADTLHLRIFSSICKGLEIYGKGIMESMLWSFESETGQAPIAIVNYPRAFLDCIRKIFGEMSAKRIESALAFQIGQDFKLQLSKSTDLARAILLAKSKAKRRSLGC